MPDSDAVNAWTQTVAANTDSTLMLTTSTTQPLLSLGNSGSYTISAEVNSNSTGVVPAGAAGLTIPAVQPPTPPCGANQKCNQD